MSLNISQYSLTELNAIKSAIIIFEKFESEYEGVIEEIEPDKLLSTHWVVQGFTAYSLAVAPVNKSLDFYFKVIGIKDLSGGNTSFLISYKPQSESSISEDKLECGMTIFSDKFKTWAEIIKKYNNVRLSKKEKFVTESAQQFYSDFELVDEDADTAPFENNKQILVYKLLEFVKESVAQVEDGDQEEAQKIVHQIERLQQAIPSVTKSVVIKELSKIYAKVKSYSMKAFVAFYDVAKKEIIKHYLYKGVDGMNEFIQTLHLPYH